jgi:phosphoribosylglycinamide formyltransferase-1
LRVAVLISGTGSNLKALIDACAAGRLDIDLVGVISNRAGAGGLAHASAAGIPSTVIDRRSAGDRGEDAAVLDWLAPLQPDLLLLSGYMRIVGAALVDAYGGRMINQHPSLLPRYKGLDTYQRALDAGDAEHGASVHFVTDELDGGPLIAQARIDVHQGDTGASLAARLAPVERRLLIATMELLAARRVEMRHGKATLDGQALRQALNWNGHELVA